MAPHRNGNLSEMPLQEFVLDGFGGGPQTQALLFALFLALYVPGAVASMEQGKVVSVFYTLVIPMLNPLIYSLRNKDVKDALRRLGQRHTAT
ncbi:hypothetical protein JEQ12_000044 [Ovis aries]|uniref:Uncharacterized protein n=1 Tax=Ovis aries TaxID=9940 RepID=A0A836AHF2_SHEEP|nr:hypothetical protein JEQ12_000044 [Ovis aries]